jgi:small subunit ribosomal protein S16
MAVTIRLQRFGSKKKPFYRIVSTNSRSKRDGRFLEQVGYYDPMQNPHQLKFVDDRYQHWVSTGANPSDTVASLWRKYKNQAN